MNAGRLRERVTIQEEARVENGRGGFTRYFVDVASTPTVSAEIIGLSGNEAIASAVERSSNVWRVIVRKRSDLTAEKRLKWNGLYLDVKSVMPWPKNPRAYTLLICESGLDTVGDTGIPPVPNPVTYGLLFNFPANSGNLAFL